MDHFLTPARSSPLLLAVLLSGCSGVLESNKPAREVFLLQPPAASAAAAAAPATVLILSVTAVPGLDTDRILVLGTDARLSPVANAHWADHLPETFTSITRRHLSQSGAFAAVREGSLARPGEWLLELELQAFYGRLDGSGEARTVELQLEGGLRCGERQQTISIRESASVGGESLSALAAAHQRTVDAALRGLPQEITRACGG